LKFCRRQSPANHSPRPIPYYPGKIQGIFAIRGLKATNPDGHKVKLYIDSYSGRIVKVKT
jgi:hypothetical protein